MDNEFKEYIEHVSSNNRFNLVYGQAGVGLTTFLLETCNYNIEKGKNVLFVEDSPLSRFDLINKDFAKNLVIISQNDFLHLDYYANPENLKHFDIIIIDTINHLAENMRTEVSGNTDSHHYNISVLHTNLRKLGRQFNNQGKTVISSCHSIRQISSGLNRDSEEKYNFVGSISLSHQSSTITELIRIEDKILIKIKKNRNSNFKLPFESVISSNHKFSIFKGVGKVHYKFFGRDICSIPENSLLFNLRCFSKKTLEEYLPNYSKNQINKFEKIVFQNESPNFNFVNMVDLCKNAFKEEFNLDDFILSESFNQKERGFCGGIGMNLKSNGIETSFSKFLNDKFSYKRSVNLLKKFYGQSEDKLMETPLIFLLTIGINYSEILEAQKYFSDVKDIKKVDKITDSLHKKHFHKKSFIDIFYSLEGLLRKIELWKNEDAVKLLEFKQNRFHEINNTIKLEKYIIEVPLNLEELQEGSKFFNNCTSNGFFLDRFIKNNDILFYIRGEHDFCVHIDSKKTIIEVKTINNIHLSRKENIIVKDILKKIKI
jgi:hypothetical protein